MTVAHWFHSCMRAQNLGFESRQPENIVKQLQQLQQQQLNGRTPDSGLSISGSDPNILANIRHKVQKNNRGQRKQKEFLKNITHNTQTLCKWR